MSYGERLLYKNLAKSKAHLCPGSICILFFLITKRGLALITIPPVMDICNIRVIIKESHFDNEHPERFNINLQNERKGNEISSIKHMSKCCTK